MLNEIGHRETWRFVCKPMQNSGDKPRTERREEINARPESGGYPKGDAEVVEGLS